MTPLAHEPAGAPASSSRQERDAETFLTQLFVNAPQGSFVELRGLRPDKQSTRRFWPISAAAFTGVVMTAMDWALERNVYVGVLPRTRRDGSSGAVDRSDWLWVDIDAGADDGDGVNSLLASAGLPYPTMIVGSGRGLHVYWRICPAVDLADDSAKRPFCDLLRRLARHIGWSDCGAHADPACADVARVLRVPGTWNHKQAPPLPVRLIRCDPTSGAHPIDWWGSHLPALPLPPPRAGTLARCPSPPIARLQGLQDWATRPIPEGERHRSLAAAAAWLRRDVGLDEDDVRRLVLDKAAASSGSHPISDAEIEGILRWA